MSATRPREIRTYRGGSLEELLPQILGELGPEAVITRQREGVVGGIGGFFGKRCVEVEVATAESATAAGSRGPARSAARGAAPGAGTPRPVAAVPRRSVVDAYDLGDTLAGETRPAAPQASPTEPVARPAPPKERPSGDAAAAGPAASGPAASGPAVAEPPRAQSHDTGSPIIDAVFAQALPFADHLTVAVAAPPEVVAEKLKAPGSWAGDLDLSQLEKEEFQPLDLPGYPGFGPDPVVSDAKRWAEREIKAMKADLAERLRAEEPVAPRDPAAQPPAAAARPAAAPVIQAGTGAPLGPADAAARAAASARAAETLLAAAAPRPLAPPPPPLAMAAVPPAPVAVVPLPPPPLTVAVAPPPPPRLAVAAVAPAPVAAISPSAVPVDLLPARRITSELVAVTMTLADAGLPENLVWAIHRDVARELRPFGGDLPAHAQARAALAKRIKTKSSWRGKRRTIALVGGAGAGKTLTAAKLCHAFAVGGGLSVGALSLGSPRAALELGLLTDGIGVDFQIADLPSQVPLAAGRLIARDLIVVDTPAVDAGDSESLDRLEGLLTALRPDETHFLVPASAAVEPSQALLDALAARMGIDRILITRLDEAPSLGAHVALSISSRLPISYLATGGAANIGLAPADPVALASMVLP